MSNKRYIIMTSASEYVLAIGHEGMQTTSSVREATILDKPQAESLLRTIKARWDNGAELIEQRVAS